MLGSSSAYCCTISHTSLTTWGWAGAADIRHGRQCIGAPDRADSSTPRCPRTDFGFRQRVRFRSAVAAASMYTTAADYARFMSALLANDQLLSLVLSKPVNVDGPLGLQWGLGWGIERAPGGPYIWQWGNNPGFRAFAMASVTSKDGLIILTNSERGMPLAASVARSVLPAEHNACRFSWPAVGARLAQTCVPSDDAESASMLSVIDVIRLRRIMRHVRIYRNEYIHSSVRRNLLR